MTIVFSCTHCARQIRALDGDAGEIAKCPECEGEVRVPGDRQLSPNEDEEPSANSFQIRTDPSAPLVRPSLIDWETERRRTNGLRGLIALTFLALAGGGWYTYDLWAFYDESGRDPLSISVDEVAAGRYRGHRYVRLTDALPLVDGAVPDHQTGPKDWSGTWIPIASRGDARKNNRHHPGLILFLPGPMNADRMNDVVIRSEFQGLILHSGDRFSSLERQTMRESYPEIDGSTPILDVGSVPPSSYSIFYSGAATVFFTGLFGWMTYRSITARTT